MKRGMHALAIELCKREGLKKQLSVAQIKEVLRCLGEFLGSLDVEDMSDTLYQLIKTKKQNPKK